MMRVRVAPLQTASQPDPRTMGEYVQKLPAGSKIRLETVQGRTLRGTLMQATNDQVLVQRNTRLPVAAEKIAMTDIVRVTLESPSTNTKLIAIGAAIGAGAAVGVIWFITFLVLSGD
jgi:hypothetical protein